MPSIPRKDGTGFRSSKEEDFFKAWEAFSPLGPLAIPFNEYKFDDDRAWRFDFAWPSLKVAVEINGFRDHGTIRGMARDAEKTRAAIALGWKVLPFTSACIGSKEKLEAAVDYVVSILTQEPDSVQKV